MEESSEAWIPHLDDHPVLFLWGEDDPFGLETAEATRNTFSAAQVAFVLIEGCGHLWQECADDFFGQVRHFFDHLREG